MKNCGINGSEDTVVFNVQFDERRIWDNARNLSKLTKLDYTFIRDVNKPVFEKLRIENPLEGCYREGEVVTLSAIFSENVNLATNVIPKLNIKIGDSTQECKYIGIENSKVLFEYKIKESDNGTFSFVSFTGILQDEALNVQEFNIQAKAEDENTIIADEDSIVADNIAPEIAIEANGTGAGYAKDVTVNITLTDKNIKECKALWKGKEVTQVDFNENEVEDLMISNKEEQTILINNYPSETGEYKLHILAIDQANNEKEFTSNVFKIDSTGPEIDVTPKSTYITNNAEKVIVTVTDENAGISEKCIDALWVKRETKKYPKGDLNFDGKITTTDYIIIKQYFVSRDKLTEKQKENILKYGDLDENGVLNTTDYLLLKSYFLGVNRPYFEKMEERIIDDLKIDDDLFSQYSNNDPIKKPTETGTYTLVLKAKDILGNVTEKNVDYKIDCDKPTKPTISAFIKATVGGITEDIAIQSGKGTNKGVSVKINGSEAYSGIREYQYRTSNDEGKTWSEWTVLTEELAEINTKGIVYYQAKAISNVGLESEISKFIVIIQNSGPMVTFKNIDDKKNGAESWIKEKNVKVEVYTDGDTTLNNNKLKYLWIEADKENSNEENLEQMITFINGDTIKTPTESGRYILYVYAEDNLGNKTNAYSEIYNIDTTAPVIMIEPNGCTETNTKDVTISITETGSGLSSTNEYQYYLSTSATEIVNGKWMEYISGETITIGEKLNGEYYLHIKGVSDNTENTCENVVSNKYVFKNVETIPTPPENDKEDPNPPENDEEDPNPVESEVLIESETYIIPKAGEENYIKKISPKTTISEFLNKVTSDKEIKILDSKGNVVKDGIMKTGMKIVVGDKEYYAVVAGDLTGDGEITLTGVTKAVLALAENISISAIEKAALDINYNGKIDLNDITKISLVYAGNAEL